MEEEGQGEGLGVEEVHWVGAGDWVPEREGEVLEVLLCDKVSEMDVVTDRVGHWVAEVEREVVEERVGQDVWVTDTVSDTMGVVVYMFVGLAEALREGVVEREGEWEEVKQPETEEDAVVLCETLDVTEVVPL